MGKQYTSVEEQVEYGLDSVPEERTVEMSMRDLLFVSQTLGLFVNFFHQEQHYPNVEAVRRFLGNREAGAFHVLSESYYKRLRDVWPEDIAAAFAESRFDHPVQPYYYEPTVTEAE